MDYSEEVRRIRQDLHFILHSTLAACKVVDGITAKYGYYFCKDNRIHKSIPIGAGGFVMGEELPKYEIAARRIELEKIIRQLEIEVGEYS